MNLSRRVTERFYAIPRISLSPLNTPIEAMDRLRSRIQSPASIHIKRDDYIGPMVWGNKLRKLEYTIARAMEQGCDTLITCGAVQSNHARTTAQVARRLGLNCVLVLNGKDQEKPTANYRISKLMQVRIELVKTPEEREPVMQQIADELRKGGASPWIIPLGASDEWGAPGFVSGYLELLAQQHEMSLRFTHIFLATSSGGTQAGLEAGKLISGNRETIIMGISADNSAKSISDRIITIADPLLQRIEYPDRLNAADFRIFDSYTGPGYGIPSASSQRASDLFIKEEGILLDDTYTAKAAGAMIDMLEEGKFDNNDSILFWHTGGTLNLF